MLTDNSSYKQNIATFRWLLYQPPESQIWFAKADAWFILTCQILSRSVYSVAFWRRKALNFADFGFQYFAVSPVGSDFR